jgi:hypothetical protein
LSNQPDETTSEQFQRRIDSAIDVNTKMAKLMQAGISASSDEATEIMAGHHSWVCEYLASDKATYLLLANKYREDDRFNGIYDEYAKGLAPFMGDAIQAYAEAKLT